jgi:hypothetical protein
MKGALYSAVVADYLPNALHIWRSRNKTCPAARKAAAARARSIARRPRPRHHRDVMENTAPMMVVLALLLAPLLALAAADEGGTFWWKFPLSDCGYDDIGTRLP